MQTINIIGAGRLGKSLAKLFHHNKLLKIKSILNSSLTSSKQAVSEIGNGHPTNCISELGPADIYLISTCDEKIQDCAEELAKQEFFNSNSIVFHCSGCLSSEILGALKLKGASIASVHPLKSFADPSKITLENFAGTYCAIEGDSKATDFLCGLFKQLSAVTFLIKPEQKSLYHTAGVFACNYLVSLFEVSLKTFEEAGINRDLGYKILAPLATNTVQNVFNTNTTCALTGPIARADQSVIQTHLAELNDWNKDYAKLYQALGLIAVELAKQQNAGNTPILEKLKSIQEYLKQE